jgi:hypothetical protein
MSIPLDRLYHYIESVAEEVYGDTVIYRFYPHGSKKIENLTCFSDTKSLRNWKTFTLNPYIFCNDQEVLNYDYYQNLDVSIFGEEPKFEDRLRKDPSRMPNYNLRIRSSDIYDCCILLHSECRSIEVDRYKENYFIPVYYWSHALIALDWFRFAKHIIPKKNNNTKLFLIYNRSWSGTREYRLKFADCLVENNLVDYCQTTCNTIDPELNILFDHYKFKNPAWKPIHNLIDYFPPTGIQSHASADFDFDDYNNTDFEVVLETIFDDSRLHFTEKILRPIACGQPFLLVGTHGSLEYLRSYGFETFSNIIDESYDTIVDPRERLTSIINSMILIKSWTEDQRKNNMKQLQEIADRNRQHFFSDKFFNHVVGELKSNLSNGLTELIETNTGQRFFNRRKSLCQDPVLKSLLTNSTPFRSRQNMAYIVQQARSYYKNYLKTLNK